MKTELLESTYKKTSNPEVGHKYHLSWANPGCVWILKEVFHGGIFCKLQTVKTKKFLLAKVEELRLLKPDAHGYKPN